MVVFLSTLSLRRATPKTFRHCTTYLISIHALLAESDEGRKKPKCRQGHFYPRSPCGERPSRIRSSSITAYFYPRSPCGERLDKRCKFDRDNRISIHALLAESDSQQTDGTTNTTYFYPRSPCGERHNRRVNLFRFEHFYPRSPCGERPTLAEVIRTVLDISIHALLAESDRESIETLRTVKVISIHALLAESDPEPETTPSE